MDDKNKKFGFSAMTKYMGAGLTAFCVIVTSIAFFFMIYKINVLAEAAGKIFAILRPFIIGLVVAYLLSPLVDLFDKLLKKGIDKFNSRKKAKFKIKLKSTRGISVFSAVLVGVAAVGVLISMVVPELVKSITNLFYDLPNMMEHALAKITEYTQSNEQLNAAVMNGYAQLTDWINDLASDWTGILANMNGFSGVFDKFNSVLSLVAVSVKSIVMFILNILVGIIVAIYVLNSRETFIGQAKKLVYAILPPKHTAWVFEVARDSDRMFGGFIIGKVIDSLIIGVLCFIGMSVLRLPYVVLISVIVGVTNVIPFFGPYIGAVPSALLILLVNPVKSLYFLIFILVLQQIDGNIIGPKILGNKTGLTPFWVVFAIMLGGGLFGFVGMLIGVPALAVILNIIKKYVNSRLAKKNMPVPSEEYIDIDVIDENGEITYLDKH